MGKPEDKLSGHDPDLYSTDRLVRIMEDEFDLENYKVIGKIGQGSTAKIFQAKHRITGDKVAVKVFNPKMPRDVKNLFRIQQEVQIAQKVNHRHLIQAFYAGVYQKKYYYFVMDYAPGLPVGTLLQEQDKLELEYALETAAQVASALAYLHRENLIHRDIKPFNIIVDERPHAKLIDFGLVKKQVGDRPALTGTILGTPYYISPEQLTRKDGIDGRCDLYSLGASLYHMVTGEPPFVGRTVKEVFRQHVQADPPNPLEIDEDLPYDLGELVVEMLAKKADNRPKTALEVEERLREIILGLHKPLEE